MFNYVLRSIFLVCGHSLSNAAVQVAQVVTLCNGALFPDRPRRPRAKYQQPETASEFNVVIYVGNSRHLSENCTKCEHGVLSACSPTLACGNDGHTYANECLAICQGAGVKHAGSCKNDPIKDDCSHADFEQVEELVSYEDMVKYDGYRLVGKARSDSNVPEHAPEQNADASEQNADSTKPSETRKVMRVDSRGNKYVRQAREVPRVSSEGFHLGFIPDALLVAAAAEPPSDDAASADSASAADADGAAPTAPADSSGPSAADIAAAAAEHARRLKVIVGEDNRNAVLNSSNTYPYTAIGQLRYRNVNTQTNYLCTGTLFSERHVLTNAHCVYDRSTDKFHSGWMFVPGLHGGEAPWGYIEYDFFDMQVDSYDSDFKNWDFAVITLKEPVGLSTGWMGVKALPPVGSCDSQGSVMESLNVVGYPVQGAANVQYSDFCSLDVEDECFHKASKHGCDTLVGNSGSPLFETHDDDKREWFVRAVHFAGLRDNSANLAIPIDDEMFQWLQCYRTKQQFCSAEQWL